MPYARCALAKGILSANRQQLTFAQKVKYDQLINQGLSKDEARAIAMALEKSVRAREAVRRPLAGAIAKAEYHRAFVAAAKDKLPGFFYDQLHSKARSSAGGKASGQARAAAKDDDKAALMQQRKDLKAALAEIDTQLAKSGPLPQEVGNDAPIGEQKKLKAKDKTKQMQGALARALQVVKSVQALPPAGFEKVAFHADAKLVGITKAKHQQLASCVVYEPDVPDLDGDSMTAEEIQKMAHGAMLGGLFINHEHGPQRIDAQVVESFVAPCNYTSQTPDGSDHTILKGSWVTNQLIRDTEAWGKVLDGTYKGVSMEGTALRAFL